jgi:hypothetical protein
MATIFERVSVSGHKCLILDPKESLIYPFDFGEWEEIRVGVALSVTNISGFNQPLQDESILNIYQEDYTNNFYLGIKSNNESYPNINSCSYIGIGPRVTYSGEVTDLYARNLGFGCLLGYYSSDLPSVYSWIMPSGATGYNYLNNINGGNLYLPPVFNQTGTDTYFCNLFGMNIKIKDKGTSNQSFSFSIYQTYALEDFFPFPSLANMRSTLTTATMGNNIVTGYFTSTYNNTGVPAPIPDAFYISNPFNLNRLRIHNILIEKYA